MSFDQKIISNLNVERYELAKTGKILINPPEVTHDDRFRALALSVPAAEQAPPSGHPPTTRYS